jgi:peptide deformylase
MTEENKPIIIVDDTSTTITVPTQDVAKILQSNEPSKNEISLPNLELLFYPNSILRQKSEPIEKITDEIVQLAKDMIQYMGALGGLGLSAIQVGIPKRLCVLRDEKDNAFSLVNPVIVETEGEIKLKEGCLSFPGIFAQVIRPKSAKIRSLTIDGTEKDFILEGMACRAVLHEIDHMDGILFIEKLNKIEKMFIQNKLRLLPRKIKQWQKKKIEKSLLP